MPNPDLLAASSIVASVGGACAGGCFALPAGAVACAIGIVLLVIALILFIVGEVDRVPSSTQSDPLPTGPEQDLAAAGGPAATTSGSDSYAMNTINFAMKLVNRFSTPAGEPPDTDCDVPVWWDFPGRWGVRVAYLAESKWDSGSRRVDPFGRSRAYWNAVQLVSYWASHPEVTP